MSRRLFDKKVIEIDEDSCFENKSEILWSRERSECLSEVDYFRKAVDSSSDATERTVSSCSWHNDEFDMKSTNKVKASLEAVDNTLYEGKRDIFMSEDLFKECCIWSQRFPYLRLKGEQIVNPIEEGVMSYCEASMPNKSCNQCFNSCLLVEGKRMPIHNTSQFQTRALLESPNTNQLLPDYVEDHEQYEEYLALDDSDFCDKEFLESCENKTTTYFKDFQGRIIEKLVFLLWPKVLTFLQDMQLQKNGNEDINLPPISDASRQQASSYLQRPQTEGQRYSVTDFPKLSDILTVSPKVLQQRKEYRSGSGLLRVTRPTSVITLACQSSDIVTPRRKIGSYKLASQIKMKTDAFTSCKSPFTRIQKYEEETDTSQHFLPALEEDSLESTTILQRIQFKSEDNELPSLLCNSHKLSCISLKCDGFLPPIANKNNTTNNSKFNKKNNRSSFTSGAISNISSRANSNTSRNSQSITNNTPTQQNFVTDHDELSAKKKCEKLCGDHEEKAVTLFPIVTSLVPQREKYLSNEKKEGLFGTLVGKKR